MFGAVIGDIVGSVYEWNNVKSKDFDFWPSNAQFTDDTIQTMACADWLINGGNPRDYLKKWGKRYCKGDVFGHSFFSPGFMKWLEEDNNYTYHAHTNGAVMRISPVPFLNRNNDYALKQAMEITSITHDHEDSYKAVNAYVKTMLCLFDGVSTDKIRNRIENDFGYDMNRNVDQIRLNNNKFYYSCEKTVPEAIICALEATDFEDAIRNAVSLGGDSDTLACMSGALAEARFGIPEQIAEKAITYLDNNVKLMLKKMYDVAPKSKDFLKIRLNLKDNCNG